MPNQTITIKLHDAKTIISALQVTKSHDQPVMIQAQKGINYELIDDATQFAPENIKIQRVGNDLYISFEDDGTNALDPDLVIQGYYGTDGTTTNLLIGLHENGSYYAYVPETGVQQHAVSMLADQVSVAQALGGEPLTSASYEFNPYWLLALIPLVGLAAGGGGGGGGGGTPAPSADKPDVVALNGGVVTVKPGSNNVKQVITYTDESNNSVSLTATKGSDGKWSLDKTPTGVSIDSSTGLVTIGMDAVKDGSTVTSTGTNSSNNTATDSDTAKVDDSTPTLADTPDVIALATGAVASKPGADNVKQVITYTDETNNAVTLTATKGADGKWSLDKTPSNVAIDPATGLITLGPDAVKDGSIVKSVGTDAYNNTATDSDTAKADETDPQGTDLIADKPDVLALVGGSVTVTPGADNIKEVIRYTDESNNPVILTATKGASGVWSLDSTPTGVIINPVTGVVTIGMEAVKDGSTVTSVGTDQFDNTANDSDTAKADVSSYTITFDSITNDSGTADDFITNDNTLLFKGTVDLADGNSLSVTVGATTYTTADPRLTVDGSGNWTLNLTGSALADGTYAVVATVKDTAGNSKSTISQNVVIDTKIDTDNDGQTVTFDSITDDTGSSSSDFITNDNTLLFKGTVDLADGNSLSVTVGATTYTTVDPRLTVDGSGNWTLNLTGSALADGTYAVVATVKDTAGNSKSTISQNVVIDTKIDTDNDGQTVTFDSITDDTGSSSSDFITNDNTLLFKGTVDLADGNSLSVTVGATTYTTADPRLTVDPTGNWTLDLTGTPLADATYAVVATVTDTAGNTASTTSQNVVIDTKIDTDNDGQTVTFDSITDDTGTAGDFITNDNTLLFKGTVDLADGNSLSVTVGATTYTTVDPRLTVDGSGNWTLNLTGSALADGTYAVVATVKDTAGNSKSTISQNVVIDTKIDTDNDGQTVTFDSITDDTGSSSSDFITNDNTLLFKGTVDLADGNSLSVTVGATTYTTADPRLTVDPTGNWTLDLTGTPLADATYAVVATVTDTAGNTASTTSQNVVIDTKIDTDNDGQTVTFDSITDDTGSSSSDFITNDNTLLFKGTVDLADGNSLSVTVGATTYTTADPRLTVDPTGNWTLDLTGTPLADATYAVVATVTDTAGNTASTTSQNVVIDTKIDTDNDGQTVTFDSITDDTGTAGDFITNDNTLLFNGTVDLADGNSLSVTVGATTYTTVDPRLTVDGSGNWTLDLTGTNLTDGTYPVIATVTDTAGNTASTISQNVVIDTKVDKDGDGDIVTFDSITNDTGSSSTDFITNDNTLLFNGTVDLDDGNALSVTVGATTYTTADPRLTVDGSGNWTLDLTGSALLDGSYTVVATVTDTMGNTGNSISRNVVIDTKIDTDNDGQTVTFDSITNDTGSSSTDLITNDNTLLFKGTVDLADGNTLSVSVNGVTYNTGDPKLTVDGSGNWTLDLTGSALLDGTYPVIATVTDTAGNTASTTSQNVVIDTKIDTDNDGQTVSFDSITNDSGTAGDFITNDNTLLFKGTVDLADGNTLSVSVNGITYNTGDPKLTVDGLGNWTLDLTGSPFIDGTYPVIATVTDAAGNTASTTSQNVVIDTKIDTDNDGQTVSFDSITNDSGTAGDLITNDNTLLFKGTVDLADGNTLSVSVNGVNYPATDSRLTVDGLGNWTLDLTGTPFIDGTYPVIATVTDAAGNTASTTSQNVVIDTKIDTDNDGQTVTFDSITNDSGTAGDLITNDNTLLFKGTVDLADGNTLSVSVNGVNYPATDSRLTVDGLGNWTLDLTGTPFIDGTYPVIATVTDAAGNTASTTSQNVVIDTKIDTDNDGQTVTFDSITNDTGSSSTDFITNDNTLLFKGTVDLADGNTLSVSVNGVNYPATDSRLTVDGLGNWTLDLTGSPFIDGTYPVIATVTDTAGNTASTTSQNVVIDTKIDTDNDGQTVTFDSITNDTGSSSTDLITNDNTLLFKGTVDLADGNTLSVSVNGITYNTVDPKLTVDGLGNWTLDLTGSPFIDGTYAVVATVTDAAGNTASTTSQNVVIDTKIDTDNDGQTVTFDSITNDSGTAGDFITNDNTLLFKGTVDLADGNTLSVSVNGITYNTGDPKLTVDGSGNWTLDLTGSALLDGTYPVIATVTDAAGNTASTTSQNVVIDTKIDTDNDGQTVTFDSITNDSGTAGDFITNDNTLLFKGTVDLADGNTLSVSVNGITYNTGDPKLTVDGSGNWTLDLTGSALLDGTYPVIATVTDAAGNTASTTSQNVVIDTKIDTDNDGQTVTFDSITNDSGTAGDFITNDNTLLFKGTVDLADGNTLSVSVNGVNYPATDSRLTVDGSGNWTLDLTGTPFVDGTYPVIATVTDTAGNTASTTSQNVVIDTKIDTDNDGQTVTFDSITNDSGTAGDFITNDNTLLFKGTVDLADGNALSVTVGATTYTTVDPRLTVDPAGNWTLDLTGTTLADATYAVVATVTDTAGNSKSTTSQNVVIDTKIDTDNDGQTVTFDSITNDTGSSSTDFITNDNTLLFKGTVDLVDGNSLSVTVGATTYTTADPRFTVDGLGNWTLDLTGSPFIDGTYPVIATVTDTAGNTASTTSQNVVIDTVADAPDVIAVLGGSVGIVPGGDNVQQVITYKNESDVDVTLTATKAPDGTWSLDTTPLNVSINSTTGVVSIGRDAVKDGSLVTSIGTDLLGNTAQDTGIAYPDDLTPSAADQPNVVALDDGSVTVTPGADNVEQEIYYTDEENNLVVLSASQAGDGTWSLAANPIPTPLPTGVSIDPITGVVTIGQDAVKDGSVVTSYGFDVSSNVAIDSDTAKGDVVIVSVSEEGLAGANADAVGNPEDTTNSTMVSGTLNLGNLTNVAVTGPSGITSEGQPVTWNGSITAGVYTLTGTAGGKEVAVLTLSTAGAYTFTLKQPLDHSIASLENILGLGFTIASTDVVGTTNSTLVINVEDDSPIAAPNTIHNVDVQPAAIEGDLVVSYGADHGYVQSITVDGYTLTYSSTTDLVSASGAAGSITYSFNAANDELTINKGTGEVLVVDMLTGHYSYSSLAISTAAQAPIVGINKSASLLGLVNAEALDLIGIGTNQLLTAIDPNNDIQSVVVNANSVISVGLGNYYKLDWSTAMAAEFGLNVIENNNILVVDVLGIPTLTTQSFSRLTITSLDGGSIDNLKLNEFLATVYIHQYGLDLLALGLAPTISISATDSQPVTSSTSYTDLLGVSLLDPSNDPAGVVEDTSATNTLNGTNGDDRLYGYAGSDNLKGNQGNDLLRGGAGNDTLNGGAGNDILSGGTGNDTLTGGSGNDTFLWEKGDQGTVVAPAVDTITDFSKQPVAGGGDILDLRGLLVGELAKGTSIGNLANYLYFVFDGTNTILYINTAGTLSAATPTTTSDQHITFTNVDLVGSYTTQQEIISNLLKNGNLLVDQATTNTDLNGSSSFDVVIVDNDGDTASTNITFDSTSPSTSTQPNVAPIAQAADATLLGLIGVDALGIIDLNQQAFIAVDQNQNLRSVEVKFNGLLTVNLGSLSFSASAQLAADLGLEIHINNTSGILGVVGATSTITITAADGGNIDNLAVNELLATIQLNSDVNLLSLVAGLSVSALGSFTVTATDSYGATDSDSFSSLLNAQVLQNLLGSGGNPDIIQGTSANDTLNNSASGTIHERLYGYDGDDALNGSSGNDLIRGGAGNDTLNGGDGNDLLIDGNGADTFNAGNGNDVIVISGTSFVSIDGGAGTDTLTLLDGIDLDLTTSNNITNIERIDLGNGSEGSKLTLTAADVLEVTGSNTLQIFGDLHDQVQMIGAIKGAESTINGVTMTQYTLGANTVFVDNDIVNGMGVIVL